MSMNSSPTTAQQLYLQKTLLRLVCSSSSIFTFYYHHYYTHTTMSSQTVVLRVAMTCEGCSGAVKRVLGKMEGVESYDIDMKEQKVTVRGNVQPDAIFQAVSKTGKKTSVWEAAAEPEAKPAETVAAA